MSTEPPDFSILVICTANRCRSPLAEFALRRAARTAGLGWSVGSAGTRAVPGQRADPKAVRILAEDGEDLTDWRTRRVGTEILSRSDLILVMSEVHRAEISMLDPAVLPRTRLLLGFAGQVARLDRSRLSPPDLGPALLAEARGRQGTPESEPLEVADPVGRSRRAFLRCARELETAAADIVFGRR